MPEAISDLKCLMPDGNSRKLSTFRLARSALQPSEKASCHRHPTLYVEMTLWTELSLSSQFDLQPHTANLTPHPAPVAPLAGRSGWVWGNGVIPPTARLSQHYGAALWEELRGIESKIVKNIIVPNYLQNYRFWKYESQHFLADGCLTLTLCQPIRLPAWGRFSWRRLFSS